MDYSQRPDIASDSSFESSRWQLLESYANYADAQRAVDRLSDSKFPVERIEIVGHDLRYVERVSGRLTRTSAAGAGAVAGAWWGLFIGLLVGLFVSGPEWLGLVLGGLLIGAAWGAIFGFVAHWASRGQRDFSSTAQLAAQRYDVMVEAEVADRARSLLGAGTAGA